MTLATLPILSTPTVGLPAEGPLEVRRGSPGDAPGIAGLIAPFARAGPMLPKSVDDLEATASDYVVALRGGVVVASAGLRRVDDHTVEIVGVAVHPTEQGTGLGRRLVEIEIARALAAGYLRLFALTLEPGFFTRLGFREGRVHEVPEKIRLDCVHCPRRVGCAERMMIREVALGAG